jgi:hypothetical protein
MRVGMRVGPFWVSGSTRSRSRGKPAGSSGSSAGGTFVAIMWAIAITVFAAVWPLIVFHHRHGWGYAWRAEGYWAAGVMAFIYFLKGAGARKRRRQAVKEQAAWTPVTATVSWRGTAQDLKLVLAVDNGKTYIIPVREGDPLLKYRDGDRVSGRWDEQTKFMHDIAPLDR